MQGCSPALLAKYSFFLLSLKRPVFVVLLREKDRESERERDRDFVHRMKSLAGG
jgi:hypothetical protein